VNRRVEYNILQKLVECKTEFIDKLQNVVKRYNSKNERKYKKYEA